MCAMDLVAFPNIESQQNSLSSSFQIVNLIVKR